MYLNALGDCSFSPLSNTSFLSQHYGVIRERGGTKWMHGVLKYGQMNGSELLIAVFRQALNLLLCGIEEMWSPCRPEPSSSGHEGSRRKVRRTLKRPRTCTGRTKPQLSRSQGCSGV
eukprot:4866643-Amphidinium_carterae.1